MSFGFRITSGKRQVFKIDMKIIDDLLDKITMYRLLLYYLLFLLGTALLASILGLLSFSPLSLIFSTSFIAITAYITNKVFSFVFEAPSNPESILLSSLILALIITPSLSIHSVPVFFWMGVWAAASKFIFAINRKHIFNPAAVAAVIVAAAGIGSASWWIGTAAMLPFTLAGVLIIRKIRRFDLVFYFFISSLITIILLSMLKGTDAILTLQRTFLQSPLVFFAFIMLSEPLTTPPTKFLQGVYGALVGVLFSPQLSFAGFATTPEIALVIGNIFSYALSPKKKLVLYLKEKIAVGIGLKDFVFPKPPGFNFIPGQYMEWTLLHKNMDSRGARRYLTIASSPTENTIRLGVEFYEKGSSFKKAMSALDDKTPVIAADLRGDFTLPNDKSKKLVFLAGGIGVTPFRSFIKYMIDTNKPYDFVMFYSNKRADQIVYKDVFSEAQAKFGSKIIYTLTDTNSISSNWAGERGRISTEMIKRNVQDYESRMYYISGPHDMVEAYKKILSDLKVPSSHIVTDYFSGYA